MGSYLAGPSLANIPAQTLQDNLTSTQKNSLNGIYPPQTGQTIIALSGDDGFFKFGRLVDFFTLKTLNFSPGFSGTRSTNRFTDINGLQVYAVNYVIDHATGLGWYYTIPTVDTWPNVIPLYSTFSLVVGANTYTDFRIPNKQEGNTLFDDGVAPPLNFAPFNNSTTNLGFWCSTTAKGTSTVGIQLVNMNTSTLNGQVTMKAKSSTNVYFFVRTHF